MPPEGHTVEHREDWSDYWPDWDLGPGCSCGFNGTYEECRNHRLMEVDELRIRAETAEAELASRNEDYNHLSRNYRQLRRDINRKIASYTVAAEYSDNESLRRACRNLAGELTHALDRPLEKDLP